MILDEILEILKEKSEDIAYTVNERSYTYKELYKFVSNIYNFLLKENQDKRPVIVYGHKEIFMKAAFLACSFAGMTYVPIDESMPKERFENIVTQLNPNLIIGKNISKEKINEIMKNEEYQEIKNVSIKPEDIYYIIFTSGSTGTPKGVKVTYENIDSCINWLIDITRIKKGIILNQANFSFDLSVADLYLSLISKSEHFILNDNNNFDLKKIFEELNKSNANLMVVTPSFIDLLLLDKKFNKELMKNLKTIIFCGETLKNTTVKKLYSRFDNIKIINCYGPTEATFAVTSVEITKNMAEENETLPIGKAKKDVKIYIIDDNKNKVKDGKVGEILIVGKSVADGYIGNIKNNSFITFEGGKAYLTGDLGYIKNDNLYYKGRKDKQIKYKGYRIELSDIEENLQNLGYIEKSIVIAKKNDEGKVLSIIAYIILKENIEKNSLEIKNDLQEKIPAYMCPKIKIIKEIPLNQNGKCDERKLLEEY